MTTSVINPKKVILQKGTHVVDLGEWIDPAALTVVPPLVSIAGNILQQRGED